MISSSSERATGLAGYYFVWPMHSVALPQLHTCSTTGTRLFLCVCAFLHSAFLYILCLGALSLSRISTEPKVNDLSGEKRREKTAATRNVPASMMMTNRLILNHFQLTAFDRYQNLK